MDSPKVLIADDDPWILDLVKTLLESEGFSVKSAKNGKQALHVIEQHRPDIVLLDVMMPVMDGVTCCIELRKNSETSEVPVVIMSAGTNVSRQLKEIGADAFIAKPFDADDLIKLLSNQLKNGRQPSALP